jgi:metallophosphoesterase superfamily enzyme
MLHIRECSDLHLEFYYDLYNGMGRAKEELLRLIPPLPTDKKTVLIVAGDLATGRSPQRIRTFMEILSKRFKHIIYVLGNHEHYGMPMSATQTCIENSLELAEKDGTLDLKKITLAGNEPVKVEISGVRFLLGTLWTDYADGSPRADAIQNIVKRYINDHRVITGDDGHGMTPAQFIPIFKHTVSKFGEWMEGQDNSKSVVVTHHLPSFDAVHPQYLIGDETTRMLNHAFASDLNPFILQHQPAYWFFGHTHMKYIGKIGATTLHCNPLGYPHEPTASTGAYDTTTVYSL